MPDSLPIQHCLKRFHKATLALDVLSVTTDRSETESAWSDLLLAASGIYSKLEQGSKINGKATAWFGRMKAERKNDPLLSYAHHARNSDEHGIENITDFKKRGHATITFREPFDPAKLEGLKLFIGTDNRGNVHVNSSDEDVVATKMFDRDQVILVSVNDNRYNDIFSPPYQHLGQKILEQTPKEVGRLLVIYLKKLIDEARQYGV